MAARVITIRGNQANVLLEHLNKEGVLSAEEYQQCLSRSSRVEKYMMLVEMLKKKNGGIQSLHAAVDALPLQNKGPVDDKQSEEGAVDFLFLDGVDIQEEHETILAEKDNTISELKREQEQLRKQLNAKSDHLWTSDAGQNNKEEIYIPEKEEKCSDHEDKAEFAETKEVQRQLHDENQSTTELEKKVLELEKQNNNPEDTKIPKGEKEKEEEEEEEEKTKSRNTDIPKEKEEEASSDTEHLEPGMTKVYDCPVVHIPQSESEHSRTTPMYCIQMKFDATHVNSRCCQISCAGFLINKADDIENTNGYKKYKGTTGSVPIITILPTSDPPPLHYWESRTVVELKDRLFVSHTLFEMGVCEEKSLDKMDWAYKQPKSWSINVRVCQKHQRGICTQIWGNKKQEGPCFTKSMSTAPGKSSTLCYGILVDVGKGRVSFLDFSKDRGRVLKTLPVTPKETLFPVFAVEQLEKCYINMDLVSGADNMTESKKQLIQKLCSE